ncbi:hypothetical protein V8E54_006845 [Elaphomyces granulatus]
MEAAPLTLAHTHARNALVETRKSNPVAASEEHDLAAGEFATAAQTCADLEAVLIVSEINKAIRTLHLLEQHHKKLAHLLRFQHEHPTNTANEETSVVQSNPTSQSRSQDPVVSKTPSTSNTQQHPPRLPGQGRTLQRETSSIASNLASARGIPAHPRRGSPVSPTLSAQHVGAQISEPPGRVKAGDTKLREAQSQGRASRVSAHKQPWSPPLVDSNPMASSQIVPEISENGPPKTSTDEPFQRFYSTFEGLISKLSAPLAFAGLPLGSETSSQPGPSRQKSPAEAKLDRHHAIPDPPSLSVDPDVNNLFSRAALRAIRDTNGAMLGSTAESFYVVPTTGGTVSYAGILSRAEKDQRNSIDEGSDDFVDARETPSSPELLQSFSAIKGKKVRSPEKNLKTMEELQMENQALKHLSDTLSKRLHMWEVNAQSSSMALQQSLKAIHKQSTASPAASAAVSPTQASGGAERRIKDLEELVKHNEKELEKVSRENEKLKSVLGRYRERWEKLKEGAKTRRSAEASAAGSSSPAGKIPALRDEDTATPIVDVDGDVEDD